MDRTAADVDVSPRRGARILDYFMGAVVGFVLLYTAAVSTVLWASYQAVLEDVHDPERLQRLWAAQALVFGVGLLFGTGSLGLMALVQQRRRRDEQWRTALGDALERVELARDAAERASVSKSRLIARVSHELRTPMNGVVGMTEVLLAEPLPSSVRSRMEVLDHSAQAMRAILDELLQVSRGDAGYIDVAPVAFDLHQLVGDRTSLHAQAAKRTGMELVLDVSLEVPRRVVADPVRIGQVLGNLIDNAIKYAGAGMVRVKVHRTPHGVGFAVMDDGPGVPAHERDRVFEAFARLPSGATQQGTGLGLTLCRQIVEAMDGRIGVEDAPGGGAQFWFTVPMVEARTVSVNTSPEEAEVDLSTVRVLGVDDNAINLQVLSAMLRSLAVPHEMASSGEEALTLAKAGAFDIVLMDVEMPGMNGRDATRALRQMGMAMPVLAFTAHAMVEERNACMQSGMVDVLAKPVTREALRDALLRWAPVAATIQGRRSLG